MSTQLSSILDVKYYNSKATNVTTSCFGNLTLTPEQQEFFVRRLSNIYRLYHGWLNMPLGLAGLALTALYIAAVYRAIWLHRVSRKCYVLLLNRSVGDVLACITALIIFVYVISVDKVNRDAMTLLDLFFVSSFWTAMVSYISLSVLKLYAIWQPLQYRNKVTIMQCIYLILISWVAFLVVFGYAMVTFALVKIPFLNELSGCKIETCMGPMYRRRNAAVIVVYTFTILCFLITLVLVRKAHQLAKLFHRKSAQSSTTSAKRAKSVASKLSARFPLWKLSLNVLTFAVFNAAYVVWAAILLLTATQCSFLQNFSTMMKYLGMIRFSLLLRIVMDPIISFVTDYQIRRSMLSVLGISHRVMPTPAEVLEENSSECTSTMNISTKRSSKTNNSNSGSQVTKY